MSAATPLGDVEIVSFGCRLNTYEGEVMKRAALSAGLERTILFNTCAVTAEAMRQAKKAVRNARRDHPQALILVTGCGAQIEPQAFAAMLEVDGVLGNEEKLDPAAYRGLSREFGLDGEARIRVGDIMTVRETAAHMIEAIEGRARAIVAVQNGCDHRCTFCIIPFGRGNSRSVPMGAVVEEVRRLAGKGTPEVVLSGVDLTSYGADLPGRPRLGTLVQAILRHVPDLRRLRLSSIDSVEADDALLEAIRGEARLMPHLHLSLQSGDDMILKRMKRRHSRGDAVSFCADMRTCRPDIVFGADIIAGFPTETEEMFENSLSLVRDCGLTYLHVFPFSPRAGTPAARMPQLDSATIRRRAARLRAAGEASLRAHLDAHVARHRAQPAEILVERGRRGRLADFTSCAIDFGEPGEIVTAAIVGHDGRQLIAVPMTPEPAAAPSIRSAHG